MIKMTKFSVNKKSITVIVSGLCIVILGLVFLTKAIGAGSKDKNPALPTEYNAEELYKYKSLYIGDASNVGNLLNKLPLAEFKNGISLSTESEPYGLTINYVMKNVVIDNQQIEVALCNNAAIVFALIENVDSIAVNIASEAEQPQNYQYTRSDIQKNFNENLWNYSKDVDAFDEFLKSIAIKYSSINEAVSAAIKEQGKGYYNGEYLAEGHIILDVEEKDGTVKVYTVSSVGWFGFENGIFTKISGSGAIPTVITFSSNVSGEYSLLEYKEPMDGSGYSTSIKKIFPARLHSKVLSSHDDYPDLAKQQEAQAAEYLAGISRKAEVRAGNVDKTLANINVEASNKLFAGYTKYDAFLNNCPYWIGTRERVENGTRYIYETMQAKTDDGYDLITFRQTKEDGTTIEERMYKIVGSEPQLVD